MNVSFPCLQKFGQHDASVDKMENLLIVVSQHGEFLYDARKTFKRKCSNALLDSLSSYWNQDY